MALVPLIPTLPISSGQFVIPAFFTDGSAQRLTHTGSVLMTPYGDEGADFLVEVWQAESGMAFKTPLGMVFTPGRAATSRARDGPAGRGTERADRRRRRHPPIAHPLARATYLSDLRPAA